MNKKNLISDIELHGDENERKMETAERIFFLS